MARLTHTPFSVALSAALAAGGCAPAATTSDLAAADPAVRSSAIQSAAHAGDAGAAPAIVEELECDDPLVRMLAITALQRMTGQTYGYRFDDPPAERELAVQRWVAALKSQQSWDGEQAEPGREERDG